MIHPGEILLEEFLRPPGISQYGLAKDISVHARQINEIIHASRAITAGTALRLGRYFENSSQFWMNLQARYDLDIAMEEMANRLEDEVLAVASSRANWPSCAEPRFLKTKRWQATALQMG